ncbi:hypothetical protein AAVH_25268 [Aphelenchoides avenae]|nr:hypothetical protein AAVH_25268 [Aphelenchus avenae]
MASEKAKLEQEERRMTRSSSFHSLGAPPPYESALSSPAPTSFSGNLMRAFYVYQDWRGNLTIYQDPQKLRPVYQVKNQFTFFSNRPDVVIFRADESLVGCCMIRHSLLSKCRMECYADEACAQLLTTIQREGFGGKYAFELMRSDGVKRYLWNPTTFLSMGKSYELLDRDDGGRVIATR